MANATKIVARECESFAKTVVIVLLSFVFLSLSVCWLSLFRRLRNHQLLLFLHRFQYNGGAGGDDARYFGERIRSEEHTSELQSLMRISYAVFCLKKKNIQTKNIIKYNNEYNTVVTSKNEKHH